MALLLFPLRASAGLDDLVLAFSTPGIDRYADGSAVADGECYALVWSPAGKAFSGFNADGSAVSPDDRVVLAGALARGGRCPECLFQVPAAEAAALDGGVWSVCLVDTRRMNGVPTGVKAGRPARVNRWGVVQGGVRVESASKASSFQATAAATSGKRILATASGARANTLSAVPDSAPASVITAMEVADGVVALWVTNTVPYLTYTISSSSTLDGFRRDKYADRIDGADDARDEIVIESDAYGESRFFKVTRAE